MIRKIFDFVIWYLIPFLIIIISTLFCVCSIFITRAESTKTGPSLKTEEKGCFSIVEIETHGENHEYLKYHKLYQGSITHLPNCKYCREKHIKE